MTTDTIDEANAQAAVATNERLAKTLDAALYGRDIAIAVIDYLTKNEGKQIQKADADDLVRGLRDLVEVVGANAPEMGGLYVEAAGLLTGDQAEAILEKIAERLEYGATVTRQAVTDHTVEGDATAAAYYLGREDEARAAAGLVRRRGEPELPAF